MCGIAGVLNLNGEPFLDDALLGSMIGALSHRGPDDVALHRVGNAGLAFCRLAIVDLEGGKQPMFSENGDVILICNGEIYNHRELRKDLVEKGHVFSTRCDVEVILHLYEEFEECFLQKLNGQFALCIYDRKKSKIIIARDHVGIAPLFYTFQQNVFLFSSEIKAILQYKKYERNVDLFALDQLFTFPGMVSPTTLFQGINSLKPGHYLTIENGTSVMKEFWDLNYPKMNDYPVYSEAHYLEEMEHTLLEAVRLRIQADVPVGVYLSGGLDSSLLAGMIHQNGSATQRNSFSISFDRAGIDERDFQRVMARQLGSKHHEHLFKDEEIEQRLKQAVYYSETPLKESYNTCNLALSQMVKESGYKVVVSGEGADELFGGYAGYKFDAANRGYDPLSDFERSVEEELRIKMWGDREFIYEKHFCLLEENKLALYSDQLGEQYQTFCSIRSGVIDLAKIEGRDALNRRSYIDFKFRLSDHLIADHGDRMGYANSVETRYPFLDINFIKLVSQIPPSLKLKGTQDKYLLRKLAERKIPKEIYTRPKFSYVAPGSPALLGANTELINDMLSFDTIKRQGFFNPHAVERLKKKYSTAGFEVNQTFEIDLIFFILTFGLFLEIFRMPCCR